MPQEEEKFPEELAEKAANGNLTAQDLLEYLTDGGNADQINAESASALLDFIGATEIAQPEQEDIVELLNNTMAKLARIANVNLGEPLEEKYREELKKILGDDFKDNLESFLPGLKAIAKAINDGQNLTPEEINKAIQETNSPPKDFNFGGEEKPEDLGLPDEQSSSVREININPNGVYTVGEETRLYKLGATQAPERYDVMPGCFDILSNVDDEILKTLAKAHDGIQITIDEEQYTLKISNSTGDKILDADLGAQDLNMLFSACVDELDTTQHCSDTAPAQNTHNAALPDALKL